MLKKIPSSLHLLTYNSNECFVQHKTTFDIFLIAPCWKCSFLITLKSMALTTAFLQDTAHILPAKDNPKNYSP